MATYAYGGWSFGVTLEALLDQAIVHAQVGSSAPYNQLGDNDTDRQTRVAEIVNRVIEEVSAANPALGISPTPGTISVVASTAEYVIPTTLHGVAIERIRYQDGQAAEVDTWDLEHYPRSKIPQLPALWRSGDTTRPYPIAWAYNEDRTKVVLFPTPSAASTLEVFFRTEPTAVTLGEIPTRFARVYALGVAWQLAEYVDVERSEKLMAKYERELKKMQSALVDDVMAKWVTRGSGREVPDRALAREQLYDFEHTGTGRYG